VGVGLCIPLTRRHSSSPAKYLEGGEAASGVSKQLSLAQDSERQGRPLVPPQHPWARQAVWLEEVGHRNAQRVGHPPQGLDARARTAPLDLAQKALAESRALGDRPKSRATKTTQRPESLRQRRPQPARRGAPKAFRSPLTPSKEN